MVKFTQSVKLNVDRDIFIENQLNFIGVNYELHPIVHMTAPKEWKARLLTEAPVNKKLFSSTILLFRLIPVDIHNVHFKRILENGFKESSNSITMKVWNHDRTINILKQGCILTDEISYSTRIPFLDVIIKPIYSYVFRHRHQRLIKKYGLAANKSLKSDLQGRTA
jgi:hypothetical protein